jgi:putative SOS response-associated peptidase YedK
MCGRYTQTADPAELQKFFDADQVEIAQLKANYNITPTSDVYVVDELSGRRQLRVVKWGLVPAWQKAPTKTKPLINARSESVAEKPSFRDAFKTARAIVPATGWYEWKTIGLAPEDKTKQPFYLHHSDNQPLAFAGILSAIKTESGWLRTMAILTTSPCIELEAVHDRMPVILAKEDWARWLSPTSNPATLQDLFHPTSAGEVLIHPVSQMVNSNRATGSELITEISL